jgi:stage IV sporulation protein FB
VFLVDPPPTAADLHFRLFGFPIRVTPWFWLAAVLLAMGGGDDTPESVLTWVVVMFVSILVHEFGHAFAIRYFGGKSRITLYHFGGLAMDERPDRPAGEQIAISFAGPAAGFLLAGIVTLLLEISDMVYAYRWGMVPVIPEPFESAILGDLVRYLLFVNFAWGLINLLPVYPLDGGRISREIFAEVGGGRGIVQSLWLSIITAAALAVYALVAWRTLFVPIMFGMLAYGSYQMLQAYTSRRW